MDCYFRSFFKKLRLLKGDLPYGTNIRLDYMFPHGEWLEEDTFAVNLHPNCVCLIVRDHDVYW